MRRNFTCRTSSILQKRGENKTSVSITAFCLQTSTLKSASHEISGTLLFNGVIEKMQCTSKA